MEIKLIEGTFTPSEAADLIDAMLEVKINFHKLHRLHVMEGDRTDSCADDGSRIDELLNYKKEVMAMLKEANQNGSKITLDSNLKLNIE